MTEDRMRRFARAMRHEGTEAEKRMWRLLRGRRFAGWKFRRQAPLGPYILDFISFEAMLVIEVDGGQHAESAADVRRDAWLAQRGYSVLRFWNNDVMVNREGVLESILNAVALTPTLSRKRERE